jgi:hypothetical protein
MKAHYSTHSTDTAGNNGTAGNSHMGNIHNTLVRSLFRPKRQRQNAARERKPVPLPPIRLREVSSLYYLLCIKQGSEVKVFRFIWTKGPRNTP